MSRIEKDLRDMFADRATSGPYGGLPAADAADRAIRHGAAVRRRRRAGASVGAALVLVLVAAGVAPARSWWQPADPPAHRLGLESTPAPAPTGHVVPTGAPAAPPPPSPAAVVPGADAAVLMHTPDRETTIGIDLRVGDQLWTTDGRRLPLSGVGEVLRAYRVPVGWVYGGATNVRLLRPDGDSVPLRGGGDGWTVSSDGARFAYVSDGALGVADLTADGLSVRSTTDVPPGTVPVAFLDRRVVVAGRVGHSRGYDLLDPTGPYRPSWNLDVTAIYGTAGGAVAALIRTGDRGLCLAALDGRAHRLRVDRSGACTLGLRAEFTPGRLAPGGGWLVAPAADGLTLVDIDAALTGDYATVGCPVRSTVPAVWADDMTVVAGDDRGVVQCRTDGTQQVVSLPPDAGADWQPVPRMTAKPITAADRSGRS
ncbi:hypothetical protein [Polymorphospora sp. NPDC050346]|uniref:hypothetical protein n=1 Tax=Polymorphospora sp. NPDC050346 TaxID=3155780 RepID=UPI0034104F26